MRSRRLLAWVVILAVAAGTWFLSTHLDQRHQEEETKASRLLALEDAAAVQSLELTGRDYPEPVRLERQGQGWRLTQPLDYPADGLAVGRMLNALLQARISQRLASPGPLKDFGLDPPLIDLALGGPQDTTSRLLVGELSPSGESVYLAHPGQTEVLLAPAELRGALSRGVLELRDKTVLDFAVAQVRRVEMKQGVKTLILERGETGWVLAGQGAADPKEVETLLFQAHGLLAQGFVDRDFKLAKLGLEPPLGRLLLTLEDGSQTGLLWGVQVPGKNQVHARRYSGGPLLLVQEDSQKRLERRPQELLDRRLFTLEASAVDRLKIVQAGRETLFARQNGQWRRSEPPGDQAAGQAGEALVWDLLDLKWEKPLPAGEHGLDQPGLTLTMWSQASPGAGQTLELGRVDRQSGLLAARRQGQQGLYGIKADIINKIPPGAPAGNAPPGDQGQ